jgi:hypothetical protein
MQAPDVSIPEDANLSQHFAIITVTTTDFQFAGYRVKKWDAQKYSSSVLPRTVRCHDQNTNSRANSEPHCQQENMKHE